MTLRKAQALLFGAYVITALTAGFLIALPWLLAWITSDWRVGMIAYALLYARALWHEIRGIAQSKERQ